MNAFWDALPEIFGWITAEVQPPLRTRIEPGSSEIAIRSRVLPMAMPVRSRPALEIIRFAAANQLCVDLTYDGSVRRIEPYSLRQTAEGNFVLHAIRSDSGEHRSYRVDKMQRAAVTAQPFVPRYVIELTPEGPFPVNPPAARPREEVRLAPVRIARRAPPRAPGRASSFNSGPTYVYRCPLCQKTFERKTMDGALNPHKHPRGYPCSGRTGIYVRTKY